MNIATEENNLAHYSRMNDERIKDLIEDNMPALKLVEAMFLEIADRTHNGELEDACTLFFDEVMPVLRKELK